MIRTLRAYFLSRLLREKILLLAFVLIGVLVWASSFGSQASVFWRAARATTAALKDQDDWLRRRIQIETTAQKAAGQLDASQTLDGPRLYSEALKLARDTGVRLSSPTPAPDVTNGQFSFHTLGFTVSFGNTTKDWLAFQSFYTQLRDRVPYIGINEFTLAIRGNPPQHYLQLKVSSVEIAAK